MPDRKPEPWESGAAAPFLWIETAQGNVEVWALGEDRFAVRACGPVALIEVGVTSSTKLAQRPAPHLG